MNWTKLFHYLLSCNLWDKKSSKKTFLKFKSGTPGPPSIFESKTPGPTSKFKSGILILIFLHCLTYYVLDKYIYIWYGINFPRIVGILSYILCSELIRHFREIFNVTMGVPIATEGSFFDGGGRDTGSLFGIQLARYELNRFVCLTWYLSDNLNEIFPKELY